MARLKRCFVPDQPGHVIQRGNRREPVFAADDDYRFYRSCLADAASRHSVVTHALMLMTHHVDLLVTPEASRSVPRALASVGRR